MIDPRRLRVLAAVATHGSVAAAAQALHLTPPAVSQQLLALERETGASLVDRSGKQVALTAAGRLLAAHGERIAAQLRQAERDLAELTGQAAGPVRIAAFQSIMAALIAPALRGLAAAHPAIQPVITERYGPTAVTGLRLGDLDIVLTEYDAASPPPAEPGLGLRLLVYDPYVLVVPPDWQLTPRGLVDLVGRPWVAGPPGTACDYALRRLAAQAGIANPDGDVCVEFPSVLALVAAGRGAAIVPRLALTQAPVTVCALPSLGGRHVAAWYPAGQAQPAPPTVAVLDALTAAGQAPSVAAHQALQAEFGCASERTAPSAPSRARLPGGHAGVDATRSAVRLQFPIRIVPLGEQLRPPMQKLIRKGQRSRQLWRSARYSVHPDSQRSSVATAPSAAGCEREPESRNPQSAHNSRNEAGERGLPC